MLTTLDFHLQLCILTMFILIFLIMQLLLCSVLSQTYFFVTLLNYFASLFTFSDFIFTDIDITGHYYSYGQGRLTESIFADKTCFTVLINLISKNQIIIFEEYNNNHSDFIFTYLIICVLKYFILEQYENPTRERAERWESDYGGKWRCDKVAW